MTEDILKEICTCYGEVKRVNFINFEGTTKPKGVAYVEYPNEEEAKKGLEYLNPSEIQL